MTYLEYCQSFLPPEDYQALLPYIDEPYSRRESPVGTVKYAAFVSTYNWSRCPDILKTRAALIYDALSRANNDQNAARNGTPLT